MKNDFDIVELMWFMRERKRKGVISIEGVPPLIFKGYGKNLKNYRIYGNTVNGESVGDFVETGEHAGEYRVPVTVSNGTDTQTTNLYLPEQIKMVGNEAEYIDYKEQKQHRVRKNLFSTELEQGNILNDGTLTDSESRLRTKNYVPCKKGDYVLSFSGENIKFGCRYYDANYNIIASTGWIVKNSVFSIDRINTKYIKLNFAKDNTTENISPSDITDIQLEKGSTATEYEPYIANTELDITLHTLPTLSDTNILSVGTTVQPSKVEITGRIKQV